MLQPLPPDSSGTLCVTALGGNDLEKAREEIIRAVEVHGGSTRTPAANEVIASFGAPKRHADHALRALRAACDQISFLAAMSAQSGSGSHCTVAVGIADELAALAMLSRLDQPGVVLATQTAVDAVLQVLPNLWDIVNRREEEMFGVPAGLQPTPAGLHGRTVLVGAHVRSSPELAAFRFRCIGALPLERAAAAVIVYAVDRPTHERNETLTEFGSPGSEQRVGRYQLVELVGRGACADVWRAYDDRGQVVALKRLRSGSTATDQERRRFQREGEILGRLQNSQICRVHEVGAADGVAYIAMEFIEGVTLAEILAAVSGLSTASDASIRLNADLSSLITQMTGERSRLAGNCEEPPTVMRSEALAKGRTLPIPQTLRLMRKICAGIEYAHAHGVLHRDLKPGNVLVRPDGEPIITDFGLGKLCLAGDASLSHADQILGTLDYMAPEQARSSRDIDERADVYALGAILYQMLTGRKPFLTSGHLLHDAQRLQTHEPIAPAELGVRLDGDLERIVATALRNRPSDRYASVTELRCELDRYERGEPVAARAPALLAGLRARWQEHSRRAASLARRLRPRA
ncbi:MAG: protein kinase family protein [Chthoniobacter sp.]|nr:protein kinase family protein [Chthoniobacter sp.]